MGVYSRAAEAWGAALAGLCLGLGFPWSAPLFGLYFADRPLVLAAAALLLLPVNPVAWLAAEAAAAAQLMARIMDG